jgi:epoxyqueuosine reductase
MSEKSAEKRAAWVETAILEFWASSEANSLENGTGEKAWGAPRIGFARGDDPLFARLKEDIGPFYWTPAEAFRLAFPGTDPDPSNLSVISWILPQTEVTRKEQAREKEHPSERWARSRFFGEAFNCDLRLYLAKKLTSAGFPAVAPERLPGFDYRRSERFGLASNWSERHTAWIAGHGTFGLSDGLITPLGKAVRFGSVVAAIKLLPTSRSYSGHQDWCLWHSRGTCGACIPRCPVGAISAAGHDKERCRDYVRQMGDFAGSRYGTGATPCGLCQVGIPCEDRIPV